MKNALSPTLAKEKEQDAQRALAKQNHQALQKVQNYDALNLERDPGSRWVNMSNALAQAGHGLTLAEKRLMMMGVSKLDSRRALSPLQTLKTKITAAEYAEENEVDINTAYDQLQSAAKSLYERSITFFEPQVKGRNADPRAIKVQMRWVGSVHYHKGEGWIELSWWHELLPHLTFLRARYTKYQLQQGSALRSVYSWRLLELLLKFEKTGWAEYSIDAFCVAMDATEKQRKDFNNIRRRMIEPAIEELQSKNGWLIQWKPLKKGRKVTALRFDFKLDPQGRLDV